MAKIQINVEENITTAISILLKKVENPIPAFKKIAALEVSQTKLRFRNSEDPEGESWAPLKNPSAKRGGASAKPLLDTGRLSSSINSAVTKKTIFIGTNVEYGKYQQFGTEKGIPPRPFLGINDKTRANVLSVVKKFLGF